MVIYSYNIFSSQDSSLLDGKCPVFATITKFDSGSVQVRCQLNHIEHSSKPEPATKPDLPGNKLVTGLTKSVESRTSSTRQTFLRKLPGSTKEALDQKLVEIFSLMVFGKNNYMDKTINFTLSFLNIS